MATLLLQLLPIFVYFGLGMLLKRQGLADKSHGEFLLRFVFFVTLPLLILTTVPKIELTAAKALLPLVNVAVNIICIGVMYLLARRQQLGKQQFGTALVNAGIHNNSFMFPFILAVFGQAGFADAILLDLGNALWMATVMYLVAFYYGGAQHDRWTMLKRILKSPLIWSLVVSLMLSLTRTALPNAVLTLINPLAQMTAPLILVALGLYFSLKLTNVGVALQIVGARMGVGLLAGLLLATLLGAEGTTFAVIVAISAAPIGFNALTYTSLAKLDTDLSASAVSLSLIAGLVGIPLLLLFTS
ncbi:MAG: AEC family transporter [Pseudomonadota bacterium]